MSLWYCAVHGFTGPMACCQQASRATIGPTIPVDTILTTTHPESGSVVLAVDCSRSTTLSAVTIGTYHAPHDAGGPP
jgi:hypothetical protein